MENANILRILLLIPFYSCLMHIGCSGSARTYGQMIKLYGHDSSLLSTLNLAMSTNRRRGSTPVELAFILMRMCDALTV